LEVDASARKILDDFIGCGKVVAKRVLAGCDQSTQSGASGGFEAVSRILNSDTLRRFQTHNPKSRQINIRRGLAAHDVIPGAKGAELGPKVQANRPIEDRDRSLLRARAGRAEGHFLIKRLLDQWDHTRSSG
jgi:hypothetical protein